MTFLQEQTKFYDLQGSSNWLNPYPLYKELRENEPVYFYEPAQLWFLSRYKDVEAALLDPQRFSSVKHTFFASQFGSVDPSSIQNVLKLVGNFMVDKDAPEHTQLRRVAQQGFTAKAIESWRFIIQETTDSLLDKVQDKHEMDIVADLAAQLPPTIIANILNVPEEQRKDFIEWGKDVAHFWGIPESGDIEEIARKSDSSAASFIELMENLIEERRHKSGTDMISLLVAAYEENGMNFKELPALCFLILTAGHATTTDLIANGTYALLSHPEQLQKLEDNPNLINSAIDEMIRFDTPMPMTFRTAKENIIIGGKKISAGSYISLGFGSANHDPEKFDSPEIFDITRSPNEHLSFSKGVHHCLGSALSKMQTVTCFSTLLKRMPNISLHPEKIAIRERKSLVFKGFETLPVIF
ncbi:MAG: cytochrome P450 [Scytonematopsis contorta HA4267-MV1]|jgi:cytochrome P450 PksS|nr:cytochrome P450 [Scytonematopsis contorta HA4267-MV1]